MTELQVLKPRQMKHINKQVRRMRGQSVAPMQVDDHVPGLYQPLPFYVRNLAAIIFGSFVVVIAGLILAVYASFSAVTDVAQNESDNVKALIEVVGDLIEERREERLFERQADERASQKIQSAKAQAIFFIIFSAVILAVAFQWAGLWGVGIAAMTILMVMGIAAGHIAPDFLMSG